MPKKSKTKTMPSLIEEDIIKHKENRKKIKDPLTFTDRMV